MASVTANPLAALAPQFGHVGYDPNCLQQLSRDESMTDLTIAGPFAEIEYD